MIQRADLYSEDARFRVRQLLIEVGGDELRALVDQAIAELDEKLSAEAEVPDWMIEVCDVVLGTIPGSAVGEFAICRERVPCPIHGTQPRSDPDPIVYGSVDFDREQVFGDNEAQVLVLAREVLRLRAEVERLHWQGPGETVVVTRLDDGKLTVAEWPDRPWYPVSAEIVRQMIDDHYALVALRAEVAPDPENGK